MIKVNWKLRLQNKTTLLALIALILALVYKVLELFGVVPSVSEVELLEVAEMAVGVLAFFGIVTDPTTKGLGDSERALSYDEPYESGGD